MDTFLLMNESVSHAENKEPVHCGIQGTDDCAGANGSVINFVYLAQSMRVSDVVTH